jgi:hypothetical protein
MGRARYVMDVSHEKTADLLEADTPVCTAAFALFEARTGTFL